eukprot:7770790-Alexandrium_andersonii.AAC.1
MYDMVDAFFRHTYYSMAETLPDYLDVYLSGAPQGEPEHYGALAEHILECASMCPMDQATQSAPEGLSI